MAEYVELDLRTDTVTLGNYGKEYTENAIPGFVHQPGDVVTVLTESMAQIGSEVLDQASEVAPEVYSRIGQTIYGIPRQEPVPSQSVALFTFAEDTPAVLVVTDTQIMVPSPSGEGVVVQTLNDLLAPPGGGDVEVRVVAAEAGAHTNGAFGVSDLVDDIDGVDSVVVEQLTGGVDEEDDDAYLDRLTEALTILAPRPILPGDHATLARQVPGVDRALVLDLYMPGSNDSAAGRAVGDFDQAEQEGELEPDPQTGIPRCTTVAIKPDDGVIPSIALMESVYAVLDSAREINFLNFVIQPSVTVIDIKARVVGWPGNTPEQVRDAAMESVTEWLDPAQWGSSQTTISPDSAAEWSQDDAVRLYEAVEYLNRGLGVHYVESVEIRGYPADGTAGAWGTTDIPLEGAAPLPMVGTLEITGVSSTGVEAGPPPAIPDPEGSLVIVATATHIDAGEVRVTATVDGVGTLQAGDATVFVWDDPEDPESENTDLAGEPFEATHFYTTPAVYTIGVTLTRGAAWGETTVPVTVTV